MDPWSHSGVTSDQPLAWAWSDVHTRQSSLYHLDKHTSLFSYQAVWPSTALLKNAWTKASHNIASLQLFNREPRQPAQGEATAFKNRYACDADECAIDWAAFVRSLLTSWPSRPLMRRSTAYAGDATSMWTALVRYFHNDSVRQLFHFARISYEEWTKEFVKTIQSHESCFDWPLCCGKHESGAIQGSPSMKQWLMRVTYFAKNPILGRCVTSLRHSKSKKTSY